MKCVNCIIELSAIDLEGIDLDFCEKCKGIWLDHKALSYYFQIAKSPPSFKRGLPTNQSCPRCGRVLESVLFLNSREVEIKRCPSCQGAWFEEGQMQKAKGLAERLRSAAQAASAPVPQTNALLGLGKTLLKRLTLEGVIKYALLGLLLYWFFGHFHFSSQQSDESPVEVSGPPSGSTCAGCKGSGVVYVRCDSCRGLGRYTSTTALGEILNVCKICSGEGRVLEGRSAKKCAGCEGVGWLKTPEKKCDRCRGKGSVRGAKGTEPCPDCEGAGRIEADAKLCRGCFGTGEAMDSLENLCAQCKGSGYVVLAGVKGMSCSDCLGKGKKAMNCTACNGTGKRP